jgi:hypothetical protein
MKLKICIIFILITYASCKSTDNCPAYTYEVINGDSVRYAK